MALFQPARLRLADEVSRLAVIGRSHLAAAALLHTSLAGGVACRLLGWAGKGRSGVLVSGCGGGEAYKSIHSVGVPHKFVFEPGLNGELRSTFAALAFSNDGEQKCILTPTGQGADSFARQSDIGWTSCAAKSRRGQSTYVDLRREPLLARIL